MTIENAHHELSLAQKMNPGKWIDHSKNVALAAKLITEATKEFDPDFAYMSGLLHDIGRRFGFLHIKHALLGYEYLKEKNEAISNICISHSFPNKTINEYQGKIDLSKLEKIKMIKIIGNIEYNYFDKLIQICDSYAGVDGFIKMEVRWIDVAIRNGINDIIIEKWKKIYQIKKEIEEKYGIKIEEILKIA